MWAKINRDTSSFFVLWGRICNLRRITLEILKNYTWFLLYRKYGTRRLRWRQRVRLFWTSKAPPLCDCVSSFSRRGGEKGRKKDQPCSRGMRYAGRAKKRVTHDLCDLQWRIRCRFGVLKKIYSVFLEDARLSEIKKILACSLIRDWSRENIMAVNHTKSHI